MRVLRAITFVLFAAISLAATAEEFKQTTVAATVGYEGPSARAEKQFIYSRGTPVEVLVQIEGWYKVRDAQGALVWIERRALGDRTNVQVKPNLPAEVLVSPDANSAIAFRADSGVLLTLVSSPTSATGPYAQVRHRDGQTGYVRADAVFGL